MRKTYRLSNYFEEYLEVCSSVAPNSEILQLRKLVEQKSDVDHYNSVFVTCLIDYASRKYPYLSNSITDVASYKKEKYLEGGLDFHLGIWHPEDKTIFEGQIFRDIKEFWSRIKPEDLPHYRFTFNHRYYRSDGSVSQLLQHSTFMEPFVGIPALNLAIVTDIGDYKSDVSLLLTVSCLKKDMGYVKVFSKTYTQLRKSMFSKREAEILKLSLDGMSNKMIAEKLFISVTTVKHHKQNMMEKTSTNNITGLINLSLKNSWI